MSTFVHRYELDTTRPTAREFWRDVGMRAALPALAWWCVVVGLGLLVVGPLNDLPGEAVVNEWFVEQRTATLDAVTKVISEAGDTIIVITIATITMLLLWWRTRQWWFAVIPGLAIGLQAAVFLSSSLVVARGRPDVEHLDSAPPTSSYPSGHTGASTALYVTLALVAQRIRRPWLRVLVTILLLLLPLSMGTARLYRGMHSLTDVIMGLANGVVCAFLAWGYLRRDVSGGEQVAAAAEADADRSTGAPTNPGGLPASSTNATNGLASAVPSGTANALPSATTHPSGPSGTNGSTPQVRPRAEEGTGDPAP